MVVYAMEVTRLNGNYVGDRAPVFSQKSHGRPQQRLTHEEVVERFVDYHFGRLTPAVNRAIETHVRSCARCKREGLTNAAAERQAANRRLRRVRGGKPLIGPRGRLALLALTLLVVAQIALFQVTRGQEKPLLSLINQWRAQGAVGAPPGAPIALGAKWRMPAATAGASAIALSADGQTLAVAHAGAHPSITLWSAKSEDQLAALTWTAGDAPSTLAWSPDGSMLAASSSSTIIIWSMSPYKVVTQFQLPTAPAMRVYDLRQQELIASPDPTSVFASGPLVWGPDGALSPAPTGAAGPTGVTSPQTPVIGFWSSEGVRLFGAGGGSVHIGVSTADILSGAALLDWSPDGRYLMWAALSLPVSGVGSSPASVPPDAIVQTLVTRVLTASKAGSEPGQNDALLWFAPDASRVAVCDRTQPNARMRIYDIASGAATAILDMPCANLPLHAAQWTADGAQLYITPINGPVAVYIAPQA